MKLVIFYEITSILLFELFTLTNMVIIKILYIYWYERIAEVNEYVISYALTCLNLFIIIIIIIVRIAYKEYESNRFVLFSELNQPEEHIDFRMHVGVKLM